MTRILTYVFLESSEGTQHREVTKGYEDELLSEDLYLIRLATTRTLWKYNTMKRELESPPTREELDDSSVEYPSNGDDGSIKDYDNSDTAENKAEKNRERNREHAKRTRQRKKEMIEGMKIRLLELQREVRKLITLTLCIQ